LKAQTLSKPTPAADQPLKLVDVDDPVPAENEVLIEISACGVCRTDLHIVEGDLTPPRYPVIPGHEVVGRVVRAGSAVKGLKPKDRVGVAWVGRFDETCDYCVEGRENLCEHPTFTGFDRPGGYAQKITAVASYVHRIPEGLGDDAHAAPLLCAGIIGYRSLKRSEIRPGARVLLVGFGGAAHIAIQIARAWGAEVYAISPGEDSLARAENMGAVWAGKPGNRPPKLVDHAVYFAPVGNEIRNTLASLRRGGTMSMAGIHLDRFPDLDYEKHLFQEKSVRTTTANTRADARELLTLAARLGVETDVETYPLEEANQALAKLKKGTLGAQAAVLLMKND
jgi:propanol-preferring alcohol dehydrogenase